MKNLEKDLKSVVNFLEKRNIPYYIHAGCGLFLHGIKGELDDCDIRIYHNDLKKIFSELKKELIGKFKLHLNRKHSMGVYGGYCISYSNLSNFDICSKMIANCDLGKFIFPLKLESFKKAEIKKFKSLKLPVSSLEDLLLYYLVLRRGEKDKKKDEIHIQEILSHKKFNLKKFENLIKKHPKGKGIKKLLSERIKK